MNPHITSHLVKEEGFRPYVYQDHLGYWTIGIGRLVDRRKGGGITYDEAEYLLGNDIRARETALESRLPWYKDLDSTRQAILLSMAFQMGVDGLLGFHNTLKMVREGRHEDAARGMLNSKWATQTPERAERLSNAMRTGEAQWLK